MKKASLKDKLVKHLSMQYPSWVAKGELTSIQWKDDNGKTFLPETVGRKLREAESDRRIAVKEKGVSVQYKWIPHEMRARYIPTSQRLGDKLFITWEKLNLERGGNTQSTYHMGPCSLLAV